MPRHLPIFLQVSDRTCAVAGGGTVAARKVSALVRAGARVVVYAPRLGPALTRRAEVGEIIHHPGTDEDIEVAACALVIAATDDPAANARLALRAKAAGVPVNVADRAEAGTFLLPSTVDRAPLTIAIGSGGASPILARALRGRIEALVPPGYGRLAALMAERREHVRRALPDLDARRRFWEQVVHGPTAELLFAGRETEAAAAVDDLLAAVAGTATGETGKPAVGEVYLVGAGPGDPDLLTFRALRLMQQADVVLHDRLVTPAILDLVRRDAERVYVGKARAAHTMRQEKINEQIVRLAREGKRVLRLKGGDPFIFGRGGEEIATLAAQGIPFQVVPGITAANGCAAYAGIPLTHRDHAQACVFVAGHLRDGSLDLDWELLTRPRQTVVVYMGLAGLRELCDRLQAHGLSSTMPAALIEQGTTARQRVIAATVGTLAEAVEQAAPRAPTLVIIGEVVRLRDRLSWYTPDPTNTPEGAVFPWADEDH